MKKIQPEKIKRLLVRSTNWIGDAIMTTPAIHAIRKAFPTAEITLLAKPWVAPLFEASSDVDRIFIYENNGRHKGFGGKIRLIQDLKEERYDAAILLQNAIEAALLTTLARISVRIGFNSDARGFLLTHSVKRTPEIFKEHQTHYYLEILKGAGFDVQNEGLRLTLPENAKKTAKELLQKEGIDFSRPLIGLNPSATFGPAKQWPIDRYAEVAKSLQTESGAQILLFGGPSDIELGKRLQEKIGNAVVLAGKTTLLEAAAIIECCNVFITNDSGLMHVAAALKTPVVAIFGSTNPVATGPFSENARVVRTSLQCSPCLKTECPEGHLECMMDISTENVLHAVAEIIRS